MGMHISDIQLLFILQKKAVRILTNSSFHEHTSPLFKDMNFLKLCDLVSFHIALLVAGAPVPRRL